MSTAFVPACATSSTRRPASAMCHTGRSSRAGTTWRAGQEAAGALRMRSTKSRTDSPPGSPAQRSWLGLARSAVNAASAFSAGVPCHSGLRISCIHSSIRSGRPKRDSSGAAVWRVRSSGETSTSSKCSSASRSASRSACSKPARSAADRRWRGRRAPIPARRGGRGRAPCPAPRASAEAASSGQGPAGLSGLRRRRGAPGRAGSPPRPRPSGATGLERAARRGSDPAERSRTQQTMSDGLLASGSRRGRQGRPSASAVSAGRRRRGSPASSANRSSRTTTTRTPATAALVAAPEGSARSDRSRAVRGARTRRRRRTGQAEEACGHG